MENSQKPKKTASKRSLKLLSHLESHGIPTIAKELGIASSRIYNVQNQQSTSTLTEKLIQIEQIKHLHIDMIKKTILFKVPTDLAVNRLIFAETEIKIITLALTYDREGILMQDVANILKKKVNEISKDIGAIALAAIVETVLQPKGKGGGAGATPKYLQIMKDEQGEFLQKEFIDDFIIPSLSTNFHCRSVLEEAELYFKSKAV